MEKELKRLKKFLKKELTAVKKSRRYDDYNFGLDNGRIEVLEEVIDKIKSVLDGSSVGSNYDGKE